MTLKPKQEAFCQAYVEIGNQSEAYRRSHPQCRNWTAKTVWEKASRMMADDKVQARIAELQGETAEKHEVTVQSIAKELDDAAEFAKSCKQAGAQVAAVMGKAKLYGLIVNKHENVNELTDAERKRRIHELLDARDGARAADASGAGEAGPRAERPEPISPLSEAAPVSSRRH